MALGAALGELLARGAAIGLGARFGTGEPGAGVDAVAGAATALGGGGALAVAERGASTGGVTGGEGLAAALTAPVGSALALGSVLRLR